MYMRYHFKCFTRLSIILVIGQCLFVFAAQATANAADESQGVQPIRLNFGVEDKVLQGRDIKDVVTATNIWLAWAGEEFNIRAKTIIYNHMDQMAKDFLAHKLDVVALTSLNYIKFINRTGKIPELGPAGIINGKITVKYLLTVRREPEINSISGLKGKTIALQKTGDIERLFLNILLMRNGYREMDFFFSDILEKAKPSRAVLDVFFGRTDACVVPEHVYSTLVEMNPQIGRQTIVLAESPELIPTITFFSEKYDPRLRTIIEDMVPKMKLTEKGRQMLMMYKVDDLTQPRAKDILELEALLFEYDLLKKNNRKK